MPRLQLNPRKPLSLQSNKIPWEPEDNKNYHEGIPYPSWVAEQIHQAGLGYEQVNFTPIRAVMFANCDKPKRCPNPHCHNNLTYWGMNIWKVCHHCGTLVAPATLTRLNPEYLYLKSRLTLLRLKNKLKK